MAGQRLTKRVADALEPRETAYIAYDLDLKGFGLRVSPRGVKSWIVEYRADGGGRRAPKQRMTIGATTTLTPDEARRAARETLANVRLGGDPAGDRTRHRRALSLNDLIEAFLAEHVAAKRKPATLAGYTLLLRRFVADALGTMKATAPTRADFAKLHLKLGRFPIQANRMLAAAGSMFAFAGKRGLVPEGYNPARGIERYPERGRERYLSADELERLGAAIREAETTGVPWRIDDTKPTAKHTPKTGRLTTIGPHAAAALRLLLFTGARLREILHLEWRHIDFQRGLILLPDSKTGRKAIVLNAPALAVLAGLPRASRFVVAGNHPDRPRADLNRPWQAVARQAGLDGVRLHDLRHSFASVGAGAGLGLPIIGRLLGHAHAATTQRYAHLDADPLRKASNAIAASIAAAMGEAPAGEVVALAERRRSETARP